MESGVTYTGATYTDGNRIYFDCHMAVSDYVYERLKASRSDPPTFSVGPWNSAGFNAFLEERN